jgi:hypothetical protein
VEKRLASGEGQNHSSSGGDPVDSIDQDSGVDRGRYVIELVAITAGQVATAGDYKLYEGRFGR